MPRAYLRAKRVREPREEAEQFPRTATRVIARPASDRMVRSGPCGPLAYPRSRVKRELRELAMAGIDNEETKTLSTE